MRNALLTDKDLPMFKTITILAAALLLAGCGCTTTATIPIGTSTLVVNCRGDSAERLAAQYFALATMVNQNSQFSAAALAAIVEEERSETVEESETK